MKLWPAPQNAREYGNFVLGITRAQGYTWYSVIGSRGYILNFLIDDEGRRHEIADTVRIS